MKSDGGVPQLTPAADCTKLSVIRSDLCCPVSLHNVNSDINSDIGRHCEATGHRLLSCYQNIT